MLGANKVKLLVFIPAYNEEDTIVEVIKNIPFSLEGVDAVEILVVDDGSTDNTVEKVKSETQAFVISHPRNLGLGVAFSTGIKEALKRKIDLVVTIDADGQFDPKDIPKLLKPILKRQADFVLGSRFTKGYQLPNVSEIRLLGNKLMARFISWICDKSFSDVSCGFRAYSKEALLHLNLFGKFTYTQEAILNLSLKDLKMTEVPINVRYFPHRKSFVTGSLTKYIFKALQIIFRTIIDYMPLRFFGILGGFIFSFGFILDIIMLYIFLKTGQFTPYKFIGISGLIFTLFGLVLFIVGLIADILNRTRKTKERILYYQKKKFYYGS